MCNWEFEFVCLFQYLLAIKRNDKSNFKSIKKTKFAGG